MQYHPIYAEPQQQSYSLPPLQHQQELPPLPQHQHQPQQQQFFPSDLTSLRPLTLASPPTNPSNPYEVHRLHQRPAPDPASQPHTGASTPLIPPSAPRSPSAAGSVHTALSNEDEASLMAAARRAGVVVLQGPPDAAAPSAGEGVSSGAGLKKRKRGSCGGSKAGVKSEEELDAPVEGVEGGDGGDATDDDDGKPRKQRLRFDGDLYTPTWVRYDGQRKEGFCDLCPAPGKWLQLKNSAFWYHKQFIHGISSVSGTPFTKPLALRVAYLAKPVTPVLPASADKQPDPYMITVLVEAHCHHCTLWVPIMNAKRRTSIPLSNRSTLPPGITPLTPFPTSTILSITHHRRPGSEIDVSPPTLKALARRHPVSSRLLLPSTAGTLPSPTAEDVEDALRASGGTVLWCRHAHRCHSYEKAADGGWEVRGSAQVNGAGGATRVWTGMEEVAEEGGVRVEVEEVKEEVEGKKRRRGRK
ncbi:hypothetical protein HK101_004084 [Irineochytrium annulatum]|nr:hypothetical protein HK101_004084 [Irineochytrium annulatum]